MAKNIFMKLSDADARSLDFRIDQAKDDFLAGLREGWRQATDIECELIAEERIPAFLAEADKEYPDELISAIYADFKSALSEVAEEFNAELQSEWEETTTFVRDQLKDYDLPLINSELVSYYDQGRDLRDSEACLKFVRAKINA